MSQFVCFYDHGLTGDDEDRVAIGAGSSRDEAIQDGLPTGLMLVGDNSVLAMMHSYFTTVKQDMTDVEWDEAVVAIRTARQVVLDTRFRRSQ